MLGFALVFGAGLTVCIAVDIYRRHWRSMKKESKRAKVWTCHRCSQPFVPNECPMKDYQTVCSKCSAEIADKILGELDTDE